MMSWTTVTLVLAVALVFVLSCSTCVAGPVKRSIQYECITNDDCKAYNSSGYSQFRDKLFCCRVGDAIEFSFKNADFGIASSFAGFPETSKDSSTTDEPNWDSDDDSSSRTYESVSENSSPDESVSRRSLDGDAKCTCRQVHRKWGRHHRHNHSFRRMYRRLDRWLSRFLMW